MPPAVAPTDPAADMERARREELAPPALKPEPAPAPVVAAPPPKPPAPSAFTVTGYGLMVGNVIYSDGPVNSIDPPAFATASGSTGAVQGDSGSFAVAARQSRFGLKAVWKDPPSLAGATEVAGLVEADFYGALLDQGRGYTAPIPRLRLATGSVSWGKGFKLVVGQDWSIFSPLNPDSTFHVGVPGMHATGNVWARLPQIRIEGQAGGDVAITWALGVVANPVGYDGLIFFAGTPPGAGTAPTAVISPAHVPNQGEISQVPAVEGRLGVTTKACGKPAGFGISGHFGRRRFSQNLPDTTTGGFAVDWLFPISSGFTVKGEGYVGQGLDIFGGGINQGLTVGQMGAMNSVIGSLNEITSFGGWLQLIMKPADGWTMAVAGGIDRPRLSDLPLGSNRSLNMAVYASMGYELARGFTLGVEYNYLRTDLKNNNGTSVFNSFQRNVFAFNGALSF